jgi:mannose-6-phosphate isomerase-like protein (cupin superfamily)
MKLSFENTTQIRPSSHCTLWDYGVPSALIGVATSRIDGRYPEAGRVLNDRCEKTYYVLAGRAVVNVESGSFEIGPGDVVHFPCGQWHWVEGDALHVLVCHTPPWTPEQSLRLD